MAEASSSNALGDTPGLTEYFRELVRKALYKKGRPQALQSQTSPEAIEFYLVNLLTRSMVTTDVYGESPDGFREEPLALIYLRAAQAETHLRIKLLRHLGDFSLFISGFFPESLTRQVMDVGYYVQMGENAYGCLSTLMSGQSALAQIFEELARRFVAYVDILSEVSEKASVRRDKDLIRLYEFWLKTGSQRAADLLASEGIQPVPGFTPPSSCKIPN